MLLELHIKDFAIIDHLEINFQSGLNIFTGETGAGKSIIIDAVEMVLGGRADTNIIRTGADQAFVEAVFKLPDAPEHGLMSILNHESLVDNYEYLILAREIRQSGRNISRVNGRVVTASLQREIGDYLIDIHGQSEHLSLLHVNQHIDLLDRYASSDPSNHIDDLLSTYKKNYRELQKILNELDNIRKTEHEAARKIDIITYQVNEIEAAQLKPNEESELFEKRNRLANAESLATLTQEALIALDEGTPESQAVTDLFGQALQALTNLSRIDKSQTDSANQAQLLSENLNELVNNLREYLEGIEFSPRVLDQVEERLALIDNLKRKYGDSIEYVLNFAQKAKQELSDITRTEERIELLEIKKDNLLSNLRQIGLSLSESRQKAARILENEIKAELNDLKLVGARIKVNFQRREDPEGIQLENGLSVAYYPNGLERVEFLIETNPGEGFKPLVKIASGGETSRLMMALKYVLANADRIYTLIFDEIDQGIGGRVGAVVGKKLFNLSCQHQILCITHLPQLAAFANQHFHVEKTIHEQRTTTQVDQLHDEQRVEELAKMLGGISEGTLKSADELLQSANNNIKLLNNCN